MDCTSVSEQFSISENDAFVNGDGVDKPHGFLSRPDIDNQSYNWGSLGYIKTGDADGFDSISPADVLIDVIYALRPIYRRDAIWMMNSKTAAAVRKIKDNDGRYIWNDLVSVDKNPTLLGYRVYL